MNNRFFYKEKQELNQEIIIIKYFLLQYMTSQFNQKQIIELEEAFMLFDKKGDGSIKTEDLGKVIRSLGHNLSKTQLQTMLNKANTKNDQNILLSEFLSIMETYSGERMKDREQLIDAFKVFDHSGYGLITASELRQAMLSLGEKLSEEQIDDMIREASNDGSINYEQFVKKMMGR